MDERRALIAVVLVFLVLVAFNIYQSRQARERAEREALEAPTTAAVEPPGSTGETAAEPTELETEVVADETAAPDAAPPALPSGEEPPEKGTNFQGEWRKGKKDAEGVEIPISHPNSRCTVLNTDIGNYNEAMAEDPDGVPVKVITYSGRDSDTMPPVWAALSPDHGVVLGASLVSAATAT